MCYFFLRHGVDCINRHNVISCNPHVLSSWSAFLADRTNGRAYVEVVLLSDL